MAVIARLIDRVRMWPVSNTPDSWRYLSMADGNVCPSSFTFRWLTSVLCRRDALRWRIAQYGGTLLIVVGTGLLAPDWKRGLAAASMMLAMPVTRFNLRHAVLVDAPAMGLALASALIAIHGPIWLAIPVVLVAGAMKEASPIFAAVYAWNPWLLLGLLVIPARLLVTRHDEQRDVLDAENAWILDHPIGASIKYHKGHWLDGFWMVLPWGPAIIGLAALDWRLAAALAAGYGSVCLATDTVRLYQWAAPVLIVAATTVVPVAWLPVLVVLAIWNPWAGNGV